MIYKFTGIPEENEVKLMKTFQVVGYCKKGQLLVDPDSDYKICDIIELPGEAIESFQFRDFVFIPVKDTEIFKRTREYDFESLKKKPLIYENK